MENTIRKWREMVNILRSSGQGKLRGTFEVQRHNAPSYNELYNHFNRAFQNDEQFNMTQGGVNENGVRLYFQLFPHRRQNINAAYAHLSNARKELQLIKGKVDFVKKIQTAIRKQRNIRKQKALLSLNKTPSVPNSTRRIFRLAFPTGGRHVKYPRY